MAMPYYCGPGKEIPHVDILVGSVRLPDGKVWNGKKWVSMYVDPDPEPVEAVDHPKHYGGEENAYEVIKVIEAWSLDFSLGNAVKYIARASKKDPTKDLEDLKKAAWYLQRRIEQLEKKGC